MFQNTVNYRERLNLLINNGFNPSIIYDIGAHIGWWTKYTKQIFCSSHFFLFEANEEHENILRSLGSKVFIGLLGNENTEKEFYAARGINTGDSIFREQTQYYREENINIRKLSMRTLDSIVIENNLPKPDFVKIDTQGAELLILEGGYATISNAEFILLETKILEYNLGAPLIVETIKYMDAIGYRIFDILEFHYLPSGELNEIDILFAKKYSRFFKQGILV